jgi:hypothetical protein
VATEFHAAPHAATGLRDPQPNAKAVSGSFAGGDSHRGGGKRSTWQCARSNKHGLLRPTGDDFAMLRLVLLALLPQIGGILLMVGRVHRSVAFDRRLPDPKVTADSQPGVFSGGDRLESTIVPESESHVFAIWM